MLQRKFRLSLKTRLTNASSIASPFFLLKVVENGLSYNRYGFVVSKKIDKRAVVRNKIKRKIRSCIEKVKDNIQGGHDMVFIARGTIADASAESLYINIQKVLRKENFLS